MSRPLDVVVVGGCGHAGLPLGLAFADHGRQSNLTILKFNCVGIDEMRAKSEVEVTSGDVKLAMSHLVPDVVQKITRGQNPFHILGHGSQIRHCTYGGDMAAGIVTAMEHPRAGRVVPWVVAAVEDGLI